MKVLTSNFQAEYGRAAGGYVSVTTKAGTQGVHGGARYFGRNDALNADSFFNNVNGLPRSRYRYNYLGYEIGGPVSLGSFNKSKDKLFFYWNQENFHQFVPGPTNSIQVPTAAERNGDFSHSVDGSGIPIVVRDSRNSLGNGAGTPFPATSFRNSPVSERPGDSQFVSDREHRGRRESLQLHHESVVFLSAARRHRTSRLQRDV